MNREQLEALRRQVEEDYKLDIAAIERLERRFLGTSGSIPGSSASPSSGNIPTSAYASPDEWSNFQAKIESLGPMPSAPDRPADERRPVFTANRK